jgi:hypothetical protein
VSSIQARLGRLEGRGVRCPRCGLAPDERRKVAVVYEEEPERSFKGDPHEACAGCGQPLYCVLRVVYDSPMGEEGEGPTVVR